MTARCAVEGRREHRPLEPLVFLIDHMRWPLFDRSTGFTRLCRYAVEGWHRLAQPRWPLPLEPRCNEGVQGMAASARSGPTAVRRERQLAGGSNAFKTSTSLNILLKY